MKISFRSMVYEDALTILSYASPYDVEIEVESGGDTSSKPTTLLKRSVGPSTTQLYHPLYRSNSIPDLSQQHLSGRKYPSKGIIASKKLFDQNDSTYSNCSTLNSTLKSSKSTPPATSNQNSEMKIANNQHLHHHPKFGIKVLPALDSTVHRIENENEHNTNLERRHSKKLEVTIEKKKSSNGLYVTPVTKVDSKLNNNGIVKENLQKHGIVPVNNVIGKKFVCVSDGIDMIDKSSEIVKVLYFILKLTE